MATIRIADEAHPKNELQGKEWRPADSTSIYAHDDGIYNLRSRRSSHDLSLYRTRSVQQDEDPGLHKEGDFKEKQVPSSTTVSEMTCLHGCRCLAARCFSGYHTNRLGSSTETSGPVLSTSSPQPLPRNHRRKTWLEYSPWFYGL